MEATMSSSPEPSSNKTRSIQITALVRGIAADHKAALDSDPLLASELARVARDDDKGGGYRTIHLTAEAHRAFAALLKTWEAEATASGKAAHARSCRAHVVAAERYAAELEAATVEAVEAEPDAAEK